MNYAFRMMAVVLALGVFVLQGCQSTSNYSKNNNYSYNDVTTWSFSLNEIICSKARIYKNGKKYWDTNDFNKQFVDEAKRRGLDCGVTKNNENEVASKANKNIYSSWSDNKICKKYKVYKHSYSSFFYAMEDAQLTFKEVQRRGLDCGVKKNNETNIASKPKIIEPSISSSELDAERQKRKELERKLAALEAKQKQEKQRIDSDIRVPLLEIISSKTKGKRGTIIGIARDNVQVAEVSVDGQTLQLGQNGNFQYSTFVPSDGVTLNVQVTDIAGLTSSKTIKLQRNKTTISTSISFDRLNPLVKRVKGNSNALALIVGVERYENTNADALYADRDAKMFRDYASEKLGIPENRIKTLLNDKAEYAEILITTKDWLRRASKTNKSDIYIFFAGHGLASDDGKDMYLLPYDGRPRLLNDTALMRDRLFKEIEEANPRSVTVFLDTCYSGTTRGTDMLIASRPIAIRAIEQSIPNNFTVFSAAAGDQTSKPLEEAKHGMFSYFLMKGMEGDADTNNDNKITARELHEYVKQNVVQQSSGSQTPELQGDKDRVLVQFN